MSPKSIDEFAGQDEILGEGKLLRRLIESDRMGSVIFYGPPGTGKSALAKIIAAETNAHFEHTNAVVIGISDIRKIVSQAKLRLTTSGKKTILLLDEIHHFNRDPEDYFNGLKERLEKYGVFAYAESKDKSFVKVYLSVQYYLVHSINVENDINEDEILKSYNGNWYFVKMKRQMDLG